MRQPNDPLPKNFGKTALGAVHSNYKTTPCKYWKETGECKFGEGCSFFHDTTEKRRLIDPLPNLPEGVTLPPMPEKLKKSRYNNGYKNNNYHNRSNNSVDYIHCIDGNFSPYSPNQFVNNFGQQNTMIQITNIADIAAIGGFNPNKYLSPPAPQPIPLANSGGSPPTMMPQQQFNVSQFQNMLTQPQPPLPVSMPAGTTTVPVETNADEKKDGATVEAQ